MIPCGKAFVGGTGSLPYLIGMTPEKQPLAILVDDKHYHLLQIGLVPL